MDLNKGLEKRTAIFNESLDIFLRNGHPRTLYDAARHLLIQGGKRLRPCIAMLSCEAVGGPLQKAIPFAVAIELIHNFSLVHDDIMDKSLLRRNAPTVHVKYGEPTAIMAGDLLFAKAFEVLHEISDDYSIFTEINTLFIDCIKAICEGQELDMEFEKRKTISEDEYLEMIQKKTAALFRCAAQGGAQVGGGTQRQSSAMKIYGENLGLAFQIWDDYLDISSEKETLGKDIGNDIRNGKKTLIAVHALNNAVRTNKQALDAIFGNRAASDQDIKTVFKVFIETGSIGYAEKTAKRYSTTAQNALEELEDSSAKKFLTQLADYSIKREK